MRINAAWVLLLAVGSSPASAESFTVRASDELPKDTDPPKIVHQPIRHASNQSDLIVTAVITDESGVFSPTVSYRPLNTNEGWRVVEMTAANGPTNTFSVTISAAELVGDIEYFVEAYDNQGNGPTRVGSAEAPLPVLIRVDEFPEQMQPALAESFPVAPAALTGAGVLVTAIGAALWFSATSRVSEIDAKYPNSNDGRTDADADATRSAIGRGRVGSALMITGGVAIAGSLVWFLLPSSDGVQVGASGSF